MKNKIAKPVIVLSLVSFFTDFASEMLYPITPIFLTSALGASMSIVGLLEGIAEITAGFLKGYFGNLSDKIGKRSMFVVAGYSLSGIVKSLPGLVASVPIVIISRIGDRIGKGMRTAPRDALLASYANGNSGAVFGFHRSMDTFGAVVGPLTALALLYFIPNQYQTIYLISLIPSVFAIGFAFAVKDKSMIRKEGKKTYVQSFKSAPREFKILLVLFTLFSFVNSSDVFLILKSKEISSSDTIAILGYVFYNLIYAAASFPIGILADKFGKKNLFVIGLTIFSVVYFGFAFTNSQMLIWILFSFYGIYAASTEGVAKAWVSDLIPDEWRGSAIGLLTSLSSFAIMFGSIFTGVLWDNFGSQVPFIISGVVSFLIAIVLFIKK